MKNLTVPYSEELLLHFNCSADLLEKELQFLLAVKLFELKHLSLGKAANFCDMSKIRFMFRLGEMKIPVINLDQDEISEELRDD